MYTSISVQEHRIETTFWQDFTIADAFGESAIKDTFERAFFEWRGDYRYLAELVFVLNHKLWQHYDAGNMAFATIYNNLWNRADSWALNNLKGEELSFYLAVLD